MKEKQTWMDKFGNVVTMVGTAILMNLMFLVACIPIVTIGPAWCGLLSSIRYNIRGDGWFAGFKAGFCTRFWRSLICWCIGLLMCLYFFTDLNYGILLLNEQGLTVESVTGCLIPGLFFAMTAMLTDALLILNVYIPTSVNNWLKNGVNFFRHPVNLFVSAALFWLPVIIALLWDMVIFLHVIMIVVAVYFTLVGVGSTILMKDDLIGFLLEARRNGTLTAEEGSQAAAAEEM